MPMVLSSRDGPWTAGKFIEVGFTLQSAQRFSYWSLFTDIITFRFILHHYGLLYWFGFTHVSMKALHEWRERDCVGHLCIYLCLSVCGLGCNAVYDIWFFVSSLLCYDMSDPLTIKYFLFLSPQTSQYVLNYLHLLLHSFTLTYTHELARAKKLSF